jgi:hypothetical protein
MKVKKEIIIILIIFLLSFGFNLFFSMQVPHFSSDDAYFNYRHAEFIKETYQPIVYDIQSYGGNYILDTHVWHYFLGLMSSSLGMTFAYKVIPSLFASLIVIFGYLIAKSLVKSEMAGYFGALIFAFVPNFVNLTLNQISIHVLFVPLMLLLIYSLLNINKRVGLFMISAFLITILEPMNFLLLLALILFLILMVVNDMKILKETKNATLFYVVLVILINLILFKTIYLEQGLFTIWQNIPNQLYSDYFQSINVAGLIANIGIIPIILGIAGLVIGLLGEKKREIYILGSVIISCVILLLLKLIPFELGVMLLAIMFLLTTVISIDRFIGYLKITKFVKYKTWIVGVLMIITIASLLIPSTIYARETISEGVSYGEIEALEWIEDNTPQDSVIIANVYEGNLISGVASRINVIDTQFLLAEDRYFDVSNLFQTESLVKAQQILEEYNVDYVYFSEKTKDLYDTERLRYADEEVCFEQVFENDEAVIYKVVC